MMFQKNRLSLALFFAALFFITDLFIQLSFPVVRNGTFYILLMGFFLQQVPRKSIIIFSIIVSIFIIIPLWEVVITGIPWDEVFYRSLAIGMIWTGAVIMIKLNKTTALLIESNELYKFNYDYAHELYVSVEPKEGLVIKCNKTLIKELGYEENEIIGKPIFNLYHPDCLERVNDAFVSFQKTGKVRNQELILKRKDGSKIHVLLNSSSVKNEQGETLYSRSSWQDLTIIKENQILKDHVLETTDRGYWDFDLKNDSGFMSPRYWEMFGYDSSEKGHDPNAWRDIIIKEDFEKSMDNFNEHVASKGSIPYKQILRFRHKNGSIVWVNCTGTVVLWAEDGTPLRMVGTNTDITKETLNEKLINDLNDTLKQKLAQLELANKELEGFSYSISHDLRTPLRAITGFANILLEDHADSLDEDGKATLNIITKNVVRMGKLIDDILEYSRLGKKEKRLQRIDVKDVFQSAFNDLRTEAPGRTIEFNVRNIPEAIGDVPMFTQAATNLVANAIKFTSKKDIAKIEIGCNEIKGTSIYYIKDNGAGFEEKYKNKLFTVFQRLHKSSEFEGTGIGLAFTQRIIHRHGGEIWAKSKIGEGATFYFTIPEIKKIKELQPL